jgi:hypothetical protein
MTAWTPREREGFQHLMAARRFSFGGVGIDGHTSTGEYAFRAVMQGRSAAEIFKVILSPGTVVTEEGKLYALCGIRATDRVSFDKYATILVSTNIVVATQSGCVILHEKAEDVVKRIGDGAYDSHFSKR